MGDDSFIRIEGLTKRFGKHHVIKNLTLGIPHKGITSILGLSGSGKTTLLNILVGFWKPTTGSIYYNSLDIAKNKSLIQDLFGFATQEGSIYPKLTIEENLKYFGQMHNMSNFAIQKRINELLNFFELSEARHMIATSLSTGMYRRLDIACSLIHNPKILILDEPTGNLDPVLRKKIMALIKKISDEGTKVIITSHLMGEIEQISAQLAILHKGKIVEICNPDELKDKYTKNGVIRLKSETGNYDHLLKKLKDFNIKTNFIKNESLHLYTPEPQKILLSILDFYNNKKERIKSVEINRPSIEEVFEAITRL